MHKILPIMLISFLFLSCKNNRIVPPDIEPEAILTQNLITSTEVWLQLKTLNISSPYKVTIFYADTIQVNYEIVDDSLFYIDSLYEGLGYNFYALIQNSSSSYKSNTISLNTLQTTSDIFTHESFYFGERNSSRLKDVFIINENDIWAVGLIYMNDSLGNPDPDEVYNAVHWNGQTWELKRIMFYTICGQSSLSPYEGETIWAFNENDIYFGSITRQLVHRTENNQERIICSPVSFSISDIWGPSSEDLYVAGGLGTFLRYFKGGWTQIETGTDKQVSSLLGVPDPKGGYTKYLTNGYKMLSFDQQDNLSVIEILPDMFLNQIWGLDDKLLYTAGDGIVLYKNNNWVKVGSQALNSMYIIKGDAYNNIFGISHTRSVFHFNGVQWVNFNTSTNIYYRIDVNGDLMAAVGWREGKAVLTLFKKSPLQ